MKPHLIKLLLPAFTICLLFSCSEADKPNDSNDNTEVTTNESTPENVDQADGPFEVKSGVIHYE